MKQVPYTIWYGFHSSPKQESPHPRSSWLPRIWYWLTDIYDELCVHISPVQSLAQYFSLMGVDVLKLFPEGFPPLGNCEFFFSPPPFFNCWFLLFISMFTNILRDYLKLKPVLVPTLMLKKKKTERETRKSLLPCTWSMFWANLSSFSWIRNNN